VGDLPHLQAQFDSGLQMDERAFARARWRRTISHALAAGFAEPTEADYQLRAPLGLPRIARGPQAGVT
jgi:hypothetical protein